MKGRQPRLCALTMAGVSLVMVMSCDRPGSNVPNLAQPPAGTQQLSAVWQFDGDSLVAWAGISGAAQLDDSSVVFADVGQGALVVVDSTGGLIRKVGRRGPGPGEHQYIQWFGACSDSVLVAYDPAKNEIALLDTQLKVVRTVLTPSDLSRMSVLGCLEDERLLFAREPSIIAGYGPQVWPLALVSVQLTSSKLDTVATLFGREMFVSQKHTATIQVPLGRHTLVSSADRTVYAMSSHGDSLLVFQDDGPRTVILEDLPRGLSRSALLSRAKREVIEEFPERRNQREAERVIAEMEIGGNPPRAERLLGTSDTTLWIALPTPVDSTRLWIKYSNEGEPRAHVWLPSAFRPFLADDSSMTGYLRDSTGLELPRRYRLRRVNGGRVGVDPRP